MNERTRQVLSELEQQGFTFSSTALPNVKVGVRGDERFAVINKTPAGDPVYELTDLSGRVTVTPEEAVLVLRLIADEITEFERRYEGREHESANLDWLYDIRDGVQAGALERPLSKSNVYLRLEYAKDLSEAERLLAQSLRRRLIQPIMS